MPGGQLVESGPPGALGKRTPSSPSAGSPAAVPARRARPLFRAPPSPSGAESPAGPAPGHHAAPPALLAAAARGAALAGARAEVLGAHGESQPAGTWRWRRAASCPGPAGSPRSPQAEAPRHGEQVTLGEVAPPSARAAQTGGAWAVRRRARAGLLGSPRHG